VTTSVRAAHLGAQAGMLSVGLVFMFGVSALFSLFVALIGMYQVRGLEEVRAMIADPATRQVLLAKAQQTPDSRADVREWVTDDLSPEGAPRTLRRLDDLVARQQAEADRVRGYLNRPERAILDRVSRMPTDKPTPDDLSAREVEFILRSTRQPPPPAGTEQWAYFVSFFLAFVASWPVIWAAFAFAFRGGLALSLAGITLVRPDGRRAGRFRCAVRELLVWLPITLLLMASMWVQTALPHLVALRTGLWLTAALLLPVYVMVALKNPTHPPQDRIMGTHLVPV
jgi:hypothetical protein